MIVRTYSEREFRRMVRAREYNPGGYFISIEHVSGDYENFVVPKDEKFLRLYFDDVTESVLGSIPMTYAQAVEIKRFLNHIAQNASVYVHCAAGQSRSTAVGIAIAEEYKAVIEHYSDEVRPNKLVYHLMKKAFFEDGRN